jgi:hypothetical protein
MPFGLWRGTPGSEADLADQAYFFDTDGFVSEIVLEKASDGRDG